MNSYVHRPCFPWFVHQRVRLTKPPQIAGAPRADGALRPRRAFGLHSLPTCGDWCRFRAAGRGLRPAPTCKHPQVREPQAGGASSSADALRPQLARRAGRQRGRLPAHFLRFVARLFANEPSRAHFFRFVAEADAPETPRLRPSRAKPQVKQTMMKMLIESKAPETPRTAPKEPRPARNRATNRKKCARNRFPPTPSARRPRPSAARRLRAPAGSRAAGGRADPSTDAIRLLPRTRRASIRLHIFCGSLQARRRELISCTFFEVRCS